MEAQGLNQKELARRAGLNETYVRDLLEGRSQDPKLSKITAVASALGKDLAWLVSGTDRHEERGETMSAPLGLADRLDALARDIEILSGGSPPHGERVELFRASAKALRAMSIALEPFAAWHVVRERQRGVTGGTASHEEHDATPIFGAASAVGEVTIFLGDLRRVRRALEGRE